MKCHQRAALGASIVPLCSTMEGEAVFTVRVWRHIMGCRFPRLGPNEALPAPLPPRFTFSLSSSLAPGRKWSMVTMVTASGRCSGPSAFAGVGPPLRTTSWGFLHTKSFSFWWVFLF